MKGYKVILEDIKNNVFHQVAVVADGTEEAIDLARVELNDVNKKLILYHIETVIKGAILRNMYY